MAQQIHDLAPRRGEPAAAAAKGLAERGGVNIDALHHAVVLRAAAALRTEHTARMRIVDHQQGAVTLGERRNRIELCNIAVHAEHVGGDEPRATRLRLLQSRLELVHIAMRVTQAFRLTETYAVDDGGVIECVADHRVLRAQQGLEQAGIGVEAR